MPRPVLMLTGLPEMCVMNATKPVVVEVIAGRSTRIALCVIHPNESLKWDYRWPLGIRSLTIRIARKRKAKP